MREDGRQRGVPGAGRRGTLLGMRSSPVRGLPDVLVQWVKRYLPRTQMGRSLLIIVTPLVLLQVVPTYLFYERHWDTVTRQLASMLAGDIAVIVSFLEEHHDEASRQW